MARQLVHMIDVAHKPNVEIAVISQSKKIHGMPLNVFTIYDNRLVTAELFSGEVLLRDPQDITFHLELFQFFLDHSISGAEAIEFMRSIANEFMQELD